MDRSGSRGQTPDGFQQGQGVGWHLPFVDRGGTMFFGAGISHLRRLIAWKDDWNR